MEEGQRLWSTAPNKKDNFSLNPCCNGRGSKTDDGKTLVPSGRYVLILVVMEEGQRQQLRSELRRKQLVLILVVMEEGQRLGAL